MKKPTRTNLVLGASTVALALMLTATMGSTSVLPVAAAQPAAAAAQPAETQFNAMDQRKQMIVLLEQMNRRLTTIEAKLNSGLSVKVTEMPEVKIKESSTKK